MAAFFLDSSAIVKRYVAEVGSAWVTGLVLPASGNLIYVARIAEVEVTSALARRRRGGSISPTDCGRILSDLSRDFSGEYRQVEVTGSLLAQATMIAERHALRAYDSVQLAAALRVHQRLLARGQAMTMVSSDLELNTAAVAEGLAVDDPNAHP